MIQQAQECGAPATLHPIVLEVERVREMRAVLHELANVFTGILVAGGVLAQKLQGTDFADRAASLCDLGERGAELSRRTRALLLGTSVPVSTVSAESEGMNDVG
ncbi:MAG TPA: hypothetical protein VMU24_02180 [Candidatus Acidoferrales bacterium]|jgi:hypothetical protein|nr:hypothetical protein [Candidatus Acidoferrales bacterium]